MAIEDHEGNIIPKIKISENAAKITTPHFKKVYRIFSRDTGKAEADLICLRDEEIDFTQPLELFDPSATWKRKVYTNIEAKELLDPHLPEREAGVRGAGAPDQPWPTASGRWTPCGMRSSALRIPTITMWT